MSGSPEERRWLGLSPGVQHALACIALAFLTGATFSNALHGEFVNFDDWFLVEQNEEIRSLSLRNTGRLLVRPSREGVWLPLRALSYAVDYHFWGLNAFGYHLTNLVLHAANVLLAYAVLNWLLGRRSLALLGAAWFAVHPVQVESVTWVSGRRDVLYAFFALASLLAFVRYEQRRGRQRWVLYGVSLACLGLSLLAKSSAMMLPGVLVLAVLLVERPGETLLRRLCAVVPFAALAIAITAAHYVLAQHAGIVKGRLFGSRLASVPWIFASYWRLLFFPVQLASPQARVPLTWAETEGIVAHALGVAGVVAVIWWSAPRRALALFCLGWWFILLLPFSNLIPLSMLVAERYLYLPLLGACGFGAAVVGNLAARRRWPAVACALAVLALFAVATYSRNRVWADSRIFWWDGASKWPGAPVPRIGLADAYMTMDAPELAWRQYMTIALPKGAAESHNPEHIRMMHLGIQQCYDRAGQRLEAEGRPDDALLIYETAVRLLSQSLQPDESLDQVRPRVRLAEAYERRGMWEKAREQVLNVQKLNENYPGMGEWLKRLERGRTR